MEEGVERGRGEREGGKGGGGGGAGGGRITSREEEGA